MIQRYGLRMNNCYSLVKTLMVDKGVEFEEVKAAPTPALLPADASATAAVHGNAGQLTHAAERFQELRESHGMEHDGLMLPTKIAQTYYHIAQQHRSVWTFETDLRSFSDRPWWNH